LPSAARTFTRRPAWVLFEPQLARLLEAGSTGPGDPSDCLFFQS